MSLLHDGGGLVVGHMLLLQHLLVHLGVGGHGSDHGLLGKDGLLAEDGAGGVGGLDDGGGLDGLDGSGLVHVGGLSDRVSGNRDLGGDGSVGVSLGSGVGKVAAQAVVLNGGGVVGRSTHELSWAVSGLVDGDRGGGGGGRQHGGKDNKGLRNQANDVIITGASQGQRMLRNERVERGTRFQFKDVCSSTSLKGGR